MFQRSLLFLCLIFCLSSYVFAQQFDNVTSIHGITDAYGIGSHGGGASFVDINGDGLDDLSLPSQSGDSIYLYLNTGGSFQKIASPVIELDESKQLLWADIDNDGDMDLFVSNHSSQNTLYENQGGLNMVEITVTSGLLIESADSFGACFGDYDRDGYLDLYVCNYSDLYTNHLYHNNGDLTFTEVAITSGVIQPPNLSFQSVFLDYNNDLWPDIFVAIDKEFNNLLFHNNGDGTFTEMSNAAGVDYVIDAMNAGFGDINNDGYLDIYVTNSPIAGNLMHINNGNGTFTESAATCGTTFNMNSWGGNFFDCNNDGLLDLYVNSNHVDSVNNALFVNNGDCIFIKYIGPYSGDAPWSHCSAIGDFDDDGQQDLVINQDLGLPYVLLHNQSAPSNSHWIKVNLTGVASNWDGIGAWIQVHADNVVHSHYTHAGCAYLAQNTQNIHFGLDTASIVDSIVVLWPSGVTQTLYNIAVNQTILITEQAILWEGTIDKNWNNADNWSAGTAPTITDNVFIPPGKPRYPEMITGLFSIGDDALSPAFMCKSLWIQEGGQMTCFPGASIANHALLNLSGVLHMQNLSANGVTNYNNGIIVIRGTGALMIEN